MQKQLANRYKEQYSFSFLLLLFIFFFHLILSVSYWRDKNVDKYLKAIKQKEQICHNCRAHDDEGNCYLHEDANCSLDRYFSLIIDTIKRVDKGLIT
jgi:hypothetical protein